MLLFSGCDSRNSSLSGAGPAEATDDDLARGVPLIVFDTVVHDFGEIIEGEVLMCYFDYVNEGDAPLVITAVEASCGCTSTRWSELPLAPGGKASLRVVFDSKGRSGRQFKEINVFTNSSRESIDLLLKASIKSSV